MFKGKVGTTETVRRLGVLTVLAANAVDPDCITEEERAAYVREIELTLRGCRGTTAQRIANQHVVLHAGAVLN